MQCDWYLKCNWTLNSSQSNTEFDATKWRWKTSFGVQFFLCFSLVEIVSSTAWEAISRVSPSAHSLSTMSRRRIAISSYRDHTKNAKLLYSNWGFHKLPPSVTRLGGFWKFLSKEAQIICNIFGLLWRMVLICKTEIYTFWVNFVENWATFYSNIWSQWLQIWFNAGFEK